MEHLYNKHTWIHLLMIIIICMAVYYQSLSNGFIFDDETIIVKNDFIKNWRNLKDLFNTGYFQGSKELTYRPLTTLSYFVLYALWQLNPFGYHLTSIIVHCLNVMVIYFILVFLFENKLYALLSCLLFAVHPVQGEAVNCICYNEDLLCTLFFLLSFMFYIKKGPYRPIISFFFYGLALFFKEKALLLPVMTFLFDLCFTQAKTKEGLMTKIKMIIEQNRYYYLGYGAVLLIYVVLRFIVFNPSVDIGVLEQSVVERIFAIPHILFVYIKMVVAPVPLDLDFVFLHPKHRYPYWIVFIMLLFFIGTIMSYKYNKPLSFGILWFFINLSPESNIIPIEVPLAPRFLYLPLIGIVLSINYLLLQADYLKKWHTPVKAINITGLALIISIFSIITMSSNTTWKNDMTFWTRMSERFPESKIPRFSLADIYINQREFSKAEHEIKKMIRSNPNQSQAYFMLARLFFNQGRLDEAEKQIKKTIRINPQHLQARFLLGGIYINKRKLPEAIDAWEEMLKIRPDMPEIRAIIDNVRSKMSVAPQKQE